MGQKASYVVQVRAEASVEATGGGQQQRVGLDSITLAYMRSLRCWRGGRSASRELARFSFLPCEWERRGGVMACEAPEMPSLSLDKLGRKDFHKAVHIVCTSVGAVVFHATMPLGGLLGLVRRAVAGDAALLSFKLSGGSVPFESATCNGWTCGNGGSKWLLDGPREAVWCPGHGEGGRGQPVSPVSSGPEAATQREDEARQWGDARAERAAAGEGQQGPARVCRCGGSGTPVRGEEAPGDPAEAPTEGVKKPEADAAPPSPHAPQFPSTPPITFGPPFYGVQYYTAPIEHRSAPRPSAQEEEVPEVDLGESSTLALYLRLLSPEPESGGAPPAGAEAQIETATQRSCQESPPCAQANATAAGEEAWGTAPSVGGGESPSRVGRSWGDTVLDLLGIIHLVGVPLLLCGGWQW